MTPKNLPTPEFHAVPPLGMDADTLALDARRYYSHFLGRGDHSPDTFDLYRALSLALRDRLMERWNRSRTLAWATAAWAGWPPASWTVAPRCSSRGHGLRHPLRLRHVPPAHRERPAGRGAGSLAPLRQPLGDRAPRVHPAGASSAAAPRALSPALRAPRCTAGWTPRRAGGALRRTQSPATAMAPSTPCGCGAPAATDEFDLGDFNAGDYTERGGRQERRENITMVLYPNDATESGKELRLRQQYFLVSASCRTCFAHLGAHSRPRTWRVRREELLPAQRHAPGHLAVAELMRLLMDEHGLTWDRPGRSPAK
jgi:hypothetical protein